MFASRFAGRFSRPRPGFRDPRHAQCNPITVTTVSDEIEEIEAATAAEFRRWLEANHETASAVWLIFWKKNSGRPSVDWSDAVDQALCFGWIDSKAQSVDEHRYRQYWSVRKPGSVWSKINKDKISRLTEAGLMAPMGIAAVERAKEDGSWTILDGPEAGIVPADLAAPQDLAVGTGGAAVVVHLVVIAVEQGL